MSNFLGSSIGKKIIMAVTGLFLVMFITVHLTLNLMLIFDDSGELFNLAANFMSTNPMIKVMEPVLALGFIVHIILSAILTIQNRKARPVRYAVTSPGNSSSWASRNMFILGGLILVFLVIHMVNFFYYIKFDHEFMHANYTTMIDGVSMHDSYNLVKNLFVDPKYGLIYCGAYILGAILLGLHMTHGFWSAFQSIGINNDIWRKRLENLAKFFGILFAVGFSIIPLYFIIFK